VVALDELEANRNYLRLFLQSTLQDIYRAGPGPVGVTIIIEEGYVLRHMAALVEALSIARNFGVNIIVVFQTMGQLKGLYGDDWSLFVSGAVVALPPGTGDMDTAKWISERAGQVIVPVLSASDPNSPTDLWPRPSWGPQTRARIPIEKIFAMPPWHAIAFLPGRDAPLPIRCDGYFAVPELNKRADANPYYLGKPAAAPASRRRGLRAWLLGSAACLTSLALLPGIARAPTPPSSLRVERPTHAASMPAQVAHPPPVARTKRGKKP
jgi:type IV secretory pathway TraG/TraD family ATPase VirD4